MQKPVDYQATRLYAMQFQYVAKSKTSFNIRLNNRQKDVRDTKTCPKQRSF